MILTGWKEISNHLRYGVRTVQRWESNGLPVTRVNSGRRSPVVADSEELDAWILHRIKLPADAPHTLVENRQRAQKLRYEAKRNKKQFQLHVEQFKKDVADFQARRTDELRRDSSGVR